MGGGFAQGRQGFRPQQRSNATSTGGRLAGFTFDGVTAKDPVAESLSTLVSVQGTVA